MIDSRLQAASIQHSEDMGARGYYAHDDPDGVGFDSRVAGSGIELRGSRVAENIHWGVDANATPRRIVEDWMNSPGHRANILNGQLTRVGIGLGFRAPKPVRGFAAVYTTDFWGPA